MASKKTVTLDNLAALGADRLAALLVELADSDAEIKRRLRLELAAQTGSDTVATEIGKRLAALGSARSFVDWQKRRDFVKGLDLQRTMIVDRVVQARADLALFSRGSSSLCVRLCAGLSSATLAPRSSHTAGRATSLATNIRSRFAIRVSAAPTSAKNIAKSTRLQPCSDIASTVRSLG